MSIHCNYNRVSGQVDDVNVVFRSPFVPNPEPVVPLYIPGGRMP